MVLTLDEIREKVRPICEAYKVKRLFLFGSYARGEATKESDVDFHIMLGEETTLLELGGLYVDLEDALQKEVDIVTQVPKERFSGSIWKRKRFCFMKISEKDAQVLRNIVKHCDAICCEGESP